jgi:hypothetical protein
VGRKRVEGLVGEAFWRESSERLPSAEAAAALRGLFDHVAGVLAKRIDDVKVDGGKTLSFYSGGREFLTFNVTRTGLRVYVHPPAGALFEPDETFAVEKFRFWDASFQKKSGKYRALSFWISERKYLAGAEEIIKHIPKADE